MVALLQRGFVFFCFFLELGFWVGSFGFWVLGGGEGGEGYICICVFLAGLGLGWKFYAGGNEGRREDGGCWF